MVVHSNRSHVSINGWQSTLVSVDISHDAFKSSEDATCSFTDLGSRGRGGGHTIAAAMRAQIYRLRNTPIDPENPIYSGSPQNPERLKRYMGTEDQRMAPQVIISSLLLLAIVMGQSTSPSPRTLPSGKSRVFLRSSNTHMYECSYACMYVSSAIRRAVQHALTRNLDRYYRDRHHYEGTNTPAAAETVAAFRGVGTSAGKHAGRDRRITVFLAGSVVKPLNEKQQQRLLPPLLLLRE